MLLPAGTGFTPIAVRDLNADGRADIVWERTDGRTAYWLMDGVRQVGAGDLYAAGSGWKVLGVTDYNADGYLDIIWYGSGSNVDRLWYTVPTASSAARARR